MGIEENQSVGPKASVSSKETTTSPLPWCFRCRTFSHVMKDCHIPELDFYPDDVEGPTELDNFLLGFQNELDKHPGPLTTCTRCLDLDLPDIFAKPFQKQWNSISQLRDAVDIVVPKLGEAGTIIFLSNCSSCRLLISSVLRGIPGTWNQMQIIRVRTPFITDTPFPNSLPDITTTLDRMEAAPLQRSICLEVKGTRPSVPVFGTRMGIHLAQTGSNGRDGGSTSRRIESEPDFKQIKSWIEHCHQQHPNCRELLLFPNAFKESRLIDVFQRKIVPCDITAKPDYLALSYVWGNVQQKAYSMDTKLPSLPRTIEDSIIVVQKLGKRYLWVDSLCISQNDEGHKASQIAIMDLIYQTAWATIVDLSGTSADSGLPRVGSGRSVRQLSHQAGDDIFVSALPPLLTYAKQSPWSQRAWVLQEAMLSRRCLFFTHSQVYFECKELQCSEVLPTPFLRTRKVEDQEETPKSTALPIFRIDYSGVKEAEDINKSSKRIKLYDELLKDYKKRKMTYFSDSLKAFSAIIQDLSAGFGIQFVWGLPTEDLPYALGWRQKALSKRDPNYPSWSWSAWEGALTYAAIVQYGYSDEQLAKSKLPFFQPYFSARQYKEKLENPMQLIYERNLDIEHRDPWMDVTGDVDHLKMISMPFEDLSNSISTDKIKSNTRLLQVEGIILNLVVHMPESPEENEGRFSICYVYIGDEKCKLHVTLPGSPLSSRFHGQPQDFLMLSRGEALDEVSYQFLLLEWKNGVAYRLDAVTLKIPGEKLGKMKDAKPIRKRIWLG